jgi:hypothetical protein
LFVYPLTEKKEKSMKVYALKYKDQIVKLSTSEYDVAADYRWEREDAKKYLTIVYGTFIEEGFVESLTAPSA